MSTTRKGRPRRFAEFEEKIAKDFDIENEAPDNDEETGSEESGDELAGTEHYVDVGKSKLRQKDAISLGPEYRGSRVSRAALEESSEEDGEEEEEDSNGEGDGSEEFDDPETADLEADHIEDDGEISSDNALCESDDENLKDFVFRGSSKPKAPNGRIKKRPTAADFMSSSGDENAGQEEGSDIEDDESEASEEGSEFDEDGARLLDLEAEVSGEDEDEDEDEDEEDEGDEEEDEDEDEDENEDEDKEEEDDDEDENEDAKSDDGDDERAQLRKMATEGQKSIVAAMSQAAKADAEKGVAVRVQRRAYDSILNLRIRLQKALVAANSFSVVDNNSPENGTEAYQAAEDAAVKLWNTIASVRHTFMPENSRAKVGKKRKRGIDLDTPSQTIWENMQAVEQVALSHRRKVLDKWSERVKKSNAGLSTRKLVNSDTQSLVSALDEQLLSSERLVKRARTPRSCAPAQAAKKVEEDADIYDDADFYQLLLKELVDQRSTDTGAPGESVATVRWAALKETKTRKQVDRRASKGRKIRYTVHEKLQNFMAPEDRRSWEEHAVDRLFGTLFGQKMELREEEEEEGGSDEEMGGVGVEEKGLRLFRS